MSELEIEAHNDIAQAVEMATATTVKDVQANRMTATAPKTFDGLVKQLKIFTNLLFCMFDASCPLFVANAENIEVLEEYSGQAKANMSQQTMAAILWITLLQSRHFAAGKMKGEKGVLAAFTQMSNNLKTKAPV